MSMSTRAHPQTASGCSNGAVVVVEVDVPGPQPVPPHKLLVAGRALVLGVAREHALYAHADTLDILHGAPALLAEEVEADEAVGVYVGMDRDRAVG